MMILVLTYLVSAYFFSGWVCYRSFISYVNRQLQPLGMKRTQIKSLGLLIVILWPIWIVWEIKRINREHRVDYPQDRVNSPSVSSKAKSS